jgi:23S rRNA (cytosine1962-C5)-methyltransferase
VSAQPIAVVSPKGAQRLRRGSPWAYRTELEQPPETQEPGAIVAVVDRQRNPVGQAFYAQRSPLALRLLTRRPASEERVDEAFFLSRLERALARRALYARRDAFRVVHGEADGLPGLFVDRYGSAFVVQHLSEGMEVRKEMLARLVAQHLGAVQVLARDDGSGRDFEGLPREVRFLVGGPPARVSFHEGENCFSVDLIEDMKTGSFLDQVDNHLRAGELGFGEALDLFSYHGGFALALAGRCRSVVAVEADTRAATRLAENARENGRSNVQVQQGNAFDVLREMERSGRRFDTIVLDPPGLAKRKEGLATALRAYHELNLRALKCLRSEGVLITCSCSGKLPRALFEQEVLSAALDAKRPVQLLERRSAGLDHPVLAALPDTDYLKVLVLRGL